MKVFHTAIYYGGYKSSRFPFSSWRFARKASTKTLPTLRDYFVSLLFVKRSRPRFGFYVKLFTDSKHNCLFPVRYPLPDEPVWRMFDVSFQATLWFSSCTVVHRGRLASSNHAHCYRCWSFHNIFLLSTSTIIITRTTSDFSFFHLKIY